MQALVVYDSLYGNTEKIAAAVAQELAAPAIRIGDLQAEQLRGVDLLVVGTPTHGSRPSPAVKTWLTALAPHRLDGVKVAAFDTRMLPSDVNSGIYTLFAKLFGYAAQPLGRGLAKAGGTLVVQPEGFAVSGKEGPLKDGELERAAAWGRKVAEAAVATAKASR